MISVSARPGTTLNYVFGANGGNTNQIDNLQIVKGADGENPAKYFISGERAAAGVTIVVDAAARVAVTQEGGRGDILTLHDGENKFQLADIKNALAIQASEGNQITSVTLDGNNVSVSPNGYFMVEAADGSWIEITSRKNPVDVSLSFSLNDGADVSWLKATSEGNDLPLSNPMTVKSYTSILFSAAEGYELESLACQNAGVEVEYLLDSKEYLLTITSADVTAAVISASLREMQAYEGNSIVIPNGDPLMIDFRETTSNVGNLADIYVKKLENNTVNEVKTGNWVRVYCKDSQSRLTTVTANGEPVELIPNDDGLTRTAWVHIEGRTVIDAEMETPCYAYTVETYDDTKHIVSGRVFFEIDGQKVKSAYVGAGQTVKLVAEPETGYIFDHFERFYSTTPAAEGYVLEGDTYTFNASEVNENFILFKGVFKENPNETVYPLRGTTAWALDEDGNLMSGTEAALGTVGFRIDEQTIVRETTAVAGQIVHLEIVVASQDVVDNYEVGWFSLLTGFPEARIPVDYVVKAEDADAEGVIWISATMRPKGSGLHGVTSADGSLSYDADTMTLTADAPVRIFNPQGRMIECSADGSVSTAALPRGVYIAVSGKSVIKFIK